MPIYDKLARFYDAAFNPFEKRFLNHWRAETLSLLPTDGKILEIGCGTGANFALYPPNCDAVSSELSIKMLDFASPKLVGNKLVQANAESLPFAANSFDAAFATLVFCSIPDPSKAFAELRCVLKPGAKLILLEHVRPPGGLGYAFDALNVITTALIDDHFNRKTAEIAAQAGFEIVEVRQKAAGAVNLIVCTNPGSSDKTLDSAFD
jgi:ubiquinone/menaquinone biosynthesis C-methylase UbiE